MELTIFGRFHGRRGSEDAVGDAIRDVVVPTRAEPGCLSINAYRCTRDPQLFYIHSRWVDEAAFNDHVELAHTVRFIERIEPLIDHPLDVARTRSIG